MVAHTVLLAGVIGNRIWHAGAALPHFKLEIAGIIVFLLLMVLAPLCFFAFQLEHARRAGSREYGALGARYVREFRERWIDGRSQNAEAREPLLGAPDIQSLADLAGSFDVVRGMRVLPFSRNDVIRVAALVAIPLAPLTLTMIPLDQLIDRAVGVIF